MRFGGVALHPGLAHGAGPAGLALGTSPAGLAEGARPTGLAPRNQLRQRWRRNFWAGGLGNTGPSIVIQLFGASPNWRFVLPPRQKKKIYNKIEDVNISGFN